MNHRHLLVGTAIILALAARVRPARGEEDADDLKQLDKTTRSAVFLLQASTRVHRNGQHHMLQRSLRHLRDPALSPLFGFLAENPHPELQVHGVLGLAECGPTKSLDLVRVSAMSSPPIQADLVSHAMDKGLLSNDQARQLLDWKQGVDEAVKVLVTAPLIRDGQLDDRSVLHEALKSQNLARQNLAALLLIQCGEADKIKHLDELDGSDDEARDNIRAMLLNTAGRFEFKQIGPWALKMASDPSTSASLALEALKTALKLDIQGAADVWRRRFASSGDPAQRTRLALVALRLADQLPDSFADAMRRAEEPLLQKIGATAAAIKSGARVPQHVSELLELKHAVVNEWALWYAANGASDEDAVQILAGFIHGYDGPGRKSAMKLDNAIMAAKTLYDRDPESAVAVLRPILTSPDAPWPLKKGVLYGLIRCAPDSKAHSVVEGIESFDRIAARNLHLLLLAKHSRRLPPQQLRELDVLVRGGGLRGSLRLQAAWRYLVLTNQVDTALAHVLPPPSHSGVVDR